MYTAFELAGFIAAHAICSVCESGQLIPILAYTTAEGQKRLDRLAIPDLGRAIELGKQKLRSNEMDANDAVFVADGRITVGDGKLDALLIDVRAYFSPQSEVQLAIPYVPQSSTGRFRLHSPKLVVWKECEEFQVGGAMECFYDGLAGHPEGLRIWNESLDESQ